MPKNDIGQTGTVVGNQSKRRIAITRQPHVGLLSADLADAEALPRRPTNNDDAQIYKPQSIDSDVDARMATIRETLAVAGMPLLERCSLIAEWVHHAETKALSFGQNVQKSGPGRPEGGVARASRELCVPGKTPDARRKFVERALKINALRDQAKEAARTAGLDDNQSALLAVAGEHSPEAQVAKVREIAARRAAPRRKSRCRAGGDGSAKMVGTDEVQAGSEVPDGMHGVVEKISRPPIISVNDENIPSFLDRRPLSLEDQLAFDGLVSTLAAYAAAWDGASSIVRSRFQDENYEILDRLLRRNGIVTKTAPVP